MDVVNADMNLGVGGINPKGVQSSQTEESKKAPEKTEVGLSTPSSGDKVEVNSVYAKKDDQAVKGYAQKELEEAGQGLVGQMKDVIQDPSSHALEAQAGSGKTFLLNLYE